MGMLRPAAARAGLDVHGEGLVEADGAGEADALGGGAEGEIFVGDFAVGECEGGVGDVSAADIIEDVVLGGDFDEWADGGEGLGEDGGRWW